MDAVNVVHPDWFWKFLIFIALVFAFIMLLYFFYLGKRLRHRFEKWRNGKNGKTESIGDCSNCGTHGVLCLGCGLCKKCCVMETGRGTNGSKKT